ncbi:MAG: glycosyltransferase [Gammaproteobacteria bacterium]|nr:MAG: glycosyltransferase [Gammaproteobacteria bacterium]
MAAIESVCKQTRPAHEILVIDDGSTDDTRNIVSANFPDVRYRYQDNGGVSQARNTGIRLATGDWIALLDSDDQWHHQKLERQACALQENPDYKICHSDEIWIRNGKRVNPMHKHAKKGGHIFRHGLPRCAISPSSVLISKRLLEEVGTFDESLPACEDYDLWLRVCARHPVLYLEEPLIIKYGGHADQLSRRYWGMDRFRVYALQKIIRSGELSSADCLAAVQMLLEKAAIVHQGTVKRGNTDLAREYEDIQAHYGALLDNLRTTRDSCSPLSMKATG